MAEEEVLARLRQGTAGWNAWRSRYCRGRRVNLFKADLRGADLRGADLSEANLVEANLSEANLGGAKLIEANLSEANLWGSKLHKANLTKATLGGASFGGADLRETRLSGADLHEAHLLGANLSRAQLREADLRGADLSDADLSQADLSEAYLNWAKLGRANLTEAALGGASFGAADLREANLSWAQLSGADLREANLSWANLNWANLCRADLRDAYLSRAQLSGADLSWADLRRSALIDSHLDDANLTGAKLWETQRSGWSIKGIICQWIFWDRDAKESTEYGAGDFERIFSEKLRIVLHYQGGMSAVDLAMLPLIVERLQVKHPGCALHIRSVEDAGSGSVVIVTVDDIAGRDVEIFRRDFEQLRCSLIRVQQQLEREERLRFQFEARYTSLVNDIVPMLLDRVALSPEINVGQLTGPIIIEGNTMSRDTYNVHWAAAVGAKAHAHDTTVQQVWSQSSLDLPQLAQELARLRIAMKQETEGAAQQEAIHAVTAAEKAAVRGDGPTALRHLKAAGKWTLGVAEKICATVAAKAIESAIAMP